MRDGDTTESTPGLVLVGFGKYRLGEMLDWVGTDKEEDLLSAFTKWPPVYREEAGCDQKDMENACRFLAFLQDAILEYELKMNPQSEEQENTNG